MAFVRLTQCNMYAITNRKIFFDQSFLLRKYCLKLSRKGHSAHYIISRHLYTTLAVCVEPDHMALILFHCATSRFVRELKTHAQPSSRLMVIRAFFLSLQVALLRFYHVYMSS